MTSAASAGVVVAVEKGADVDLVLAGMVAHASIVQTACRVGVMTGR